MEDDEVALDQMVAVVNLSMNALVHHQDETSSYQMDPCHDVEDVSGTYEDVRVVVVQDYHHHED